MSSLRTAQKEYRIPFPAEFIIAEDPIAAGCWIIRDRAPHAEELERHVNDLYQLFVSKMSENIRKTHVDNDEEERLIQLLRTIFEFKRTLADPS